MVTQTIAVMVTDVNEVPMFTNMAYMAGVANGATAGMSLSIDSWNFMDLFRNNFHRISLLL